MEKAAIANDKSKNMDCRASYGVFQLPENLRKYKTINWCHND